VQLAIPGPAVARYATAQAFRRGIEARINATNRETGRSLARLRKQVVFARLLARLAVQAPGRWVLKGGLALDYRFGDRARSTRDIDLAMTGREDGATRDLGAAGKLDLGDYFVFSIERTDALDQLEDGSAVRYHVRSELAGRVFDEFVVDVGFDYPENADIELLRGPDLVGFAGLPVIETPTLRLERQVAEKVHAYTRDDGSAKARTTRVKDLVDIDLVAGAASVDARRLRMALEDTFASRARQDLPVKLPDPPSDWRAPFANLARELSLPTNVDAGFELAAAFLDPILQGPGLHATWSPEKAAWEPKGARR
jgi:Nucleotidyl transferase AbiEii toxin, Type IV TA system